MPKRKVFIVGKKEDYVRMFRDKGWDITDLLREADLVQFTGGSDISPSMYGEIPLKTTFSNPDRDKFEAILFTITEGLEIPMAGICRGGQFLNVMCDGELWQHVDGHTITGTHKATCLVSKTSLQYPTP